MINRATLVKQQQFKITLGDELRAKLEEESSLNYRSIAEEIRQRLEMSFDIQADLHTRDLIYSILILAAEITRDFGATWWADERARSALMAAIVDQLNSYTITPPASAEATLKPLGTNGPQAAPDDDPQVIGRAVARNFRRVFISHNSSTQIESIRKVLRSKKAET